MVRASGAALLRNTTVTSIAFAKGDVEPGAPRKYIISARDAGEQTADEEPLEREEHA